MVISMKSEKRARSTSTSAPESIYQWVQRQCTVGAYDEAAWAARKLISWNGEGIHECLLLAEVSLHAGHISRAQWAISRPSVTSLCSMNLHDILDSETVHKQLPVFLHAVLLTMKTQVCATGYANGA